MSAPSAPTETVETPASAPETPPAETEAPATTEPVVEESAAPEPEPAAALQVEAVTPEPSPTKTAEEWEREKAEAAQRAAAQALELDRRRRQTENARRAAEEKRAAEERAEAVDTIKAAFGAAGIYEVPEQAIQTSIDRVARKKADLITSQNADLMGQSFDYIVSPVTGEQIEFDDAMMPFGQVLAPKVQAFLEKLRPQLEAEARKGWISPEDLPKHVEAEIARRAAIKREGQTELVRPEGNPADGTEKGSIAWWNALGREGRSQKENQLAYDAWLSRHTPTQ